MPAEVGAGGGHGSQHASPREQPLSCGTGGVLGWVQQRPREDLLEDVEWQAVQVKPASNGEVRQVLREHCGG
eukprot:502387-Pyramimonas_sp.AAC.1